MNRFLAAALVFVTAAAAQSLTPCRPPGVPPPAECGFVQAPSDHNHPEGPIIRLRVMILRATEADPAPDSLFYLTGGPGTAATDEAATLAGEFSALRRRRDIVLVDQRGTGESVYYNCRLTTADGRPAALTSSQLLPQLVEICGKGPGAIAGAPDGMDARFFTTAQAAEDIASVASALGYPAVNLYGVSYGTRIGLAVLKRHPDLVRTLSIQGVVLPSAPIPVTGSWATQQALNRLMDDCERDAICSSSYPEFRRQLTDLLSPRGQTNPFLASTVTTALYSAASAARLPAAVADAAAGRYERLLNINAGSALNTGSMAPGLYLSILCAEDIPYITAEDLARLARDTLAGDATVRALVRTCEPWPRGAVSAADRELPRADRPVLLISGELDPITPPDQAQIAADALPASRHVILRGTGHTGTANACATTMVAEMVALGSAGGVDASCAESTSRPRFVSVMPEPPR